MSLADFNAVVENINSVDPGAHAFRYPAHAEALNSADRNSTFNVREFARRMDTLLALLDSTTDALAATGIHARKRWRSMSRRRKYSVVAVW
jgi:hypothetical protein